MQSNVSSQARTGKKITIELSGQDGMEPWLLFVFFQVGHVAHGCRISNGITVSNSSTFNPVDVGEDHVVDVGVDETDAASSFYDIISDKSCDCPSLFSSLSHYSHYLYLRSSCHEWKKSSPHPKLNQWYSTPVHIGEIGNSEIGGMKMLICQLAKMAGRRLLGVLLIQLHY